jgi:hypothetical protein
MSQIRVLLEIIKVMVPLKEALDGGGSPSEKPKNSRPATATAIPARAGAKC